MSFDFDTETDRRGTGALKWGDDERIALGLADMDFPTAPAVLEALDARVGHGVLGYTAVTEELLRSVTEWTATRRGWTTDPDWITVCPGVMPSMAHLMRGVLPAGSGIIVQTPGFDPIRDVIEVNGFEYLENPLRDVDGHHEMDLEGFRELARRPDVTAFVLCSPHNPLGRVWTLAELTAVAEVCAEHDVLVISDEIHAEVIFEGAEFITYPRAAGAASPHVTLMGPSKGFNLAGLRTSLAVIPDASVRERFRRELHCVNEDFGVSVFGAIALEAAYSRGGPWLDALTTYLRDNVAALVRELSVHVPKASVTVPEASFLAWVDLTEIDRDDRVLCRLIDEAGVTVEPGSNFGSGGGGHIRVNVATPRHRLIEAVERIGRALRTT